MEPPPAVIMGAVYERWGWLAGPRYGGGGKKADGRISASRQLLLIEFGQRRYIAGENDWLQKRCSFLPQAYNHHDSSIFDIWVAIMRIVHQIYHFRMFPKKICVICVLVLCQSRPSSPAAR